MSPEALTVVNAQEDKRRRGQVAVMLGDVKEARRLADAGQALATANLAVSAHEEKWDEVIEGAKAALADASFAPSGRPTIAVLGRYAAKKKGSDAKAFQKVLAVEKPGALLLQNPALKKFL